MAANNKRPVLVIFLILFFGCIIGTALSQLLGAILPEGVVKDFFLTSISFNLMGSGVDKTGVLILDLSVLVLKFGLSLKFNFTSIIGLASAYYMLRYFR